MGVSIPNCLAFEAGAEALPLWEEIWPGPARKLAGPLAARSPGLGLALDHEIERHCSTDEFLQGRLMRFKSRESSGSQNNAPTDLAEATKIQFS